MYAPKQPLNLYQILHAIIASIDFSWKTKQVGLTYNIEIYNGKYEKNI